MTKLYVLRHGIAVPRGTPEIPGDDRPLTPKGEKQLRQIGRGLRRLGIEPERIVSSPLIRAWRTAEIVADALGMSDRLEASETLRDDRDAGSIADWVRTRSEDRLMIVGHNPALSALLGLLVTGTTDFSLCDLKKGGVAVLASRDAGGHQLEWIAPPKLLRRVGNA
jgi:phosphohistidine phosphatase